MYIVAIAWLYVTALMAASEPTLVAGLLTFVFYGLLPLALLLWLVGTPMRRRLKRQRETSDPDVMQTEMHKPDGGDAEADQ